MEGWEAPLKAVLVVVAVALVLGGNGTLVLLAYRRRVAALTTALREERRGRQTELDQREEYVAAAARELMDPIAAGAHLRAGDRARRLASRADAVTGGDAPQPMA